MPPAASKRLAGQGAFSDTDLIAYGPVRTLEEIVFFFDQKSFYSAKEVIGCLQAI
ncbi:MAG: hypothetical protein H5U02_12250 [Clostridia bacterium]|nr:hypothetical protein [Clostridia bacterium]